MITLSKIKILWRTLKGYGYKWMVDMGLLNVPNLQNTNCDMVISLTSYGRRVADGIVYYTLVSLLRQKIQPKRIILWLSVDEWQDDILPIKLLKLKEKGIEIRYCKDIRSYKKLIPTLSLCPDSNIMTVDDDIIYTNDIVEIVWREYLKNSHVIVCLNSSIPIIDDGIPSHYDQWRNCKKINKGMIVFPVGCGGTFYPVGTLHRDVMREDLFMKLCPLADDIWFWFCGLLNKTEKIYINKSSSHLSFDALYQYFHKGSALTHTNRFEHANDKQFKQLFEYYGVIINDKGMLIKNRKE